MIKKVLAYGTLVITLMLLSPTTSMALSIGGYPVIYKGSLDINTILNGIRNTQLAGSLLTVRLILNEWAGGRCSNNGGQSTPANGKVFTPDVEIEATQNGLDFTSGKGKYLSEIIVTDEELLAAFLSGTTQAELDALCPNDNWTFDPSSVYLAGFDVDATGFFCIDSAGKVTTCPDSPGTYTDQAVKPEDRVGAHYVDDGTLVPEQAYSSTLLCDGLNACAAFFGFPAPTVLTFIIE